MLRTVLERHALQPLAHPQIEIAGAGEFSSQMQGESLQSQLLAREWGEELHRQAQTGAIRGYGHVTASRIDPAGTTSAEAA